MKPSPNLLGRALNCTIPNQIWLADITHVAAIKAFKLVRARDVKDPGDLSKAQNATRDIAGWAMDNHMRAELCCDALWRAVPGLLHHSDRGSQYAGWDTRNVLGSAKIPQSMSRTGECFAFKLVRAADQMVLGAIESARHAPKESFLPSLKKERVHRARFKTRAEAKTAIFESVEVFYTHQRLPLSDWRHHTSTSF